MGKITGLPRVQPRRGKVLKWCDRCNARHAGGTGMCELLPVYTPTGQPPRWTRPEIAERVEEYEDARADL